MPKRITLQRPRLSGVAGLNQKLFQRSSNDAILRFPFVGLLYFHKKILTIWMLDIASPGIKNPVNSIDPYRLERRSVMSTSPPQCLIAHQTIPSSLAKLVPIGSTFQGRRET